MPALLPSTGPQPGGSPPGDPRRGATAATVLRCVLDHGPLARSTIGRLTGLSAAAVSRQCAELIGLGLLRERAARQSRSTIGRPHVPVEIDTRRHLVAGVHIAMAHSTLVLTDLRGRILARRRLPHADRAPGAVLAAVGDRLADLLAEHAGDRRAAGVGLATGGWIDPARGVIVEHQPLGWREVPARAVLERRLGRPVWVENHSRALARAEQLLGAHRERARCSLVHLFVGNLVGAAIATGGAVHHGPGSAAGDVSHLPVGAAGVLGFGSCPCGRTGCLQAAVADWVIAEHAPGSTFESAVAALEAGRPWAVELFADRARLVGRAAGTLLDVINPEILVVAEAGVVRSPALLAILRAEVARCSPGRVDTADRVQVSSFGTAALGVAAGAVALHEVYRRPLDLSPPPARR